MVTITYARPPAPSTPLPTQIQSGIETGELHAEPQEGVHPTYLVSDGQNEYFFKDYTIKPEPMTMLAEWAAFKGASTSAALFYRAPLAWTRMQPSQRAAREARALRQWRAIGIDAPAVLGYDDTGLVLEAITGSTVSEKIADGTLETSHIERFVQSLHTARESALYINDPSYLHSDPKLANAIVADDRVYLIDPGMLTKDLPVPDLDAAFSLAYLTGLEGVVRDAHAHPRDERERIETLTDELAEAYLKSIGPDQRDRMLDYARPVSERHITRMRRIPSAPFQRFARWLSYSDTAAIERIAFRIR